MSHISRILSITVALLALPLAQAHARDFTYRTRVIAGDTTCEEAAQKLAAQFARATGVTPTGAECRASGNWLDRDQRYPFHSLALSYQAQVELSPYVALWGAPTSDGVPSDYQGAYARYEECVSDLGQQTVRFEAATGLTAVVATCEPGRFSTPMDRSYVLRVESLGEPSRRLFVFDAKLEGAAKEGLLSSIHERMTSQRAQQIQRRGDTFYYFAASRVPLVQQSIGVFGHREFCESQIADLLWVYAKAKVPWARAACLEKASRDPGEPARISMESIRDASPWVSSHSAEGARIYYSMPECLGDRASAVQGSIARGRNTLGAICVENPYEGTFQIQVFSKL